VRSASLDNESVTWCDTALVATIEPSGGVPIFPGPAREDVRSELSRDCHGWEGARPAIGGPSGRRPAAASLVLDNPGARPLCFRPIPGRDLAIVSSEE